MRVLSPLGWISTSCPTFRMPSTNVPVTMVPKPAMVTRALDPFPVQVAGFEIGAVITRLPLPAYVAHVVDV